MAEQGFIYILTNTADKNAIKVGKTNNLKRRLAEHNNASNTIGTWKMHWSLEVPDTKSAERLALGSLRRWRVEGRREQFKCSPQTAQTEVSVALSKWSKWGEQEKLRRKKQAAAEREVRLRQRRAAEQARQQEKQRAEQEETFKMLCQTFPERRAEYERAKQILAGEQSVPYPLRFNDIYVLGLLFLSAFLYYSGEPAVWLRLPVFAAFAYGFVAFIDAKDRFSDWKRQRDPAAYAGTIENFETVYPNGTPPKSPDDLWFLKTQKKQV